MFITKNFAHLLVIAGCATLQDLSSLLKKGLSPGSAVKNLPGNAGDTGDTGSIPGWERPLRGGKVTHLQYFPEEEMATHSSVLPWISPWTEELGSLQSMAWQRVGHDQVCIHARMAVKAHNPNH